MNRPYRAQPGARVNSRALGSPHPLGLLGEFLVSSGLTEDRMALIKTGPGSTPWAAPLSGDNLEKARQAADVAGNQITGAEAYMDRAAKEAAQEAALRGARVPPPEASFHRNGARVGKVLGPAADCGGRDRLSPAHRSRGKAAASRGEGDDEGGLLHGRRRGRRQDRGGCWGPARRSRGSHRRRGLSGDEIYDVTSRAAGEIYRDARAAPAEIRRRWNEVWRQERDWERRKIEDALWRRHRR